MSSDMVEHEAKPAGAGDRREKRGASLHRMLDRYLGIPLVFATGALTKRRRLPDGIRNIGLISLGAIGDTVLLTAMISDIRKVRADARIILIISRSNHTLIPLLEGVDEFVVLPIMRPLACMRMLRACKFDVLADFTQWPRISAIYTALAKARFTTGFRTRGQYRDRAFDMAVDHSPARHELENFRALVSAFGIAGNSRPCVRVPPAANKTAANAVEGAFVVLHPWASGYKGWLREWPVDRFIELARAVDELGYQVVITGSPDDATKAALLSAAARRRSVNVVSAAGRFSLAETTALLGRARLVVAGSTGILHLAAALDVPLLALYGPTSPDLWGPVSDKAVVMIPKGTESGYHYLGFEYPRNPINCMEFISVGDVIAAARRILSSPSMMLDQRVRETARVLERPDRD